MGSDRYFSKIFYFSNRIILETKIGVELTRVP